MTKRTATIIAVALGLLALGFGHAAIILPPGPAEDICVLDCLIAFIGGAVFAVFAGEFGD